VYRSKPFIVARLLCCWFVGLIWRNLLYIPVERETLFRVSLGQISESREDKLDIEFVSGGRKTILKSTGLKPAASRARI